MIMESNSFQSMIQNAKFSFAYHKALLDDSGNVYDFRLLEVNDEYCRQTGIDAAAATGKTIREVFPKLEDSEFDWIQECGQIALTTGVLVFEHYCKNADQRFMVHLISAQIGYFAAIISRIKPGESDSLQSVNRYLGYQKRTEQELEEKNAYIESLLAAIPDMMLVIDKNGVVTDLKSGNLESLYLPRDQVLDQNLKDVLPGELAEHSIAKIKEVLQSKEIGQMDYKLGSSVLHDYDARISPLGNQQVIALVRDVTEQRKAVVAIRQQNKFQKMIADISTIFVRATVNDIDQVLYDSLARVGRFFDIHRAYIFRYSHDFSLFYNANEWCAGGIDPISSNKTTYPTANTPWWHEQILKGNLILIEDIADLPKQATAEAKIMQRYNIGSLLFVPIETGTRVLGYFGFDSIGVKRQFSESEIDNLKVIANLLGEILQKFDYERKLQAQSRLQQLISQIALQYINLPVDHLADSITDALAEMASFANADRAFVFDYDWEHELCINTSEWCAEGIRPVKDDLQKVPLSQMLSWVDRHKAGEPVIVADINQLAPDDSVRKILTPQEIISTITVPLMHGNHCLGFVGFDFVRRQYLGSDTEITLLKLFAQLLVNVHNRKELEAGLIWQKERAEAANNAKSEFLANMNHEIRTPLNGVVGFTELILNSTLNPTQAQYAQNIINSSHKLMGIIDDILDFSKIEAGKLELDPLRTDLIQLLEHAADIVKVKTAKKKLELLLDIPPDLPRYAVLDPLRLNQILMNLFSNAEKFTQEGEIELKVSYQMTDGDHADIRFCVRDTGIGIDHQQKRRLFKAFSQLDSSTTRKYGGTGLGLVISNHLAQLMDSEIKLNSEVGQGSEFSFVINCRVERAESSQHQELKQIRKVLIIDDNAKNRVILQNMLKYWNIETESFANAMATMEYVQENRTCDAMILDFDVLLLHEMKTIKLIREQLSGNETRLPIILMHNSTGDSYLQEAAQELGSWFQITKPVRASELYTCLKYLAAAEAEVYPESKAPVEPKPTPFRYQENPRILIAEDNFLNLTLLKELIIQQIPQAQILTASDGIQALNQTKEHHPHLVLMDIQMPNLDGIAATVEIRKFSKVPILAITADAFSEERNRCFEAGMNDFLTKPVLSHDLNRALIKHLPLSPVDSFEDSIAPSVKEQIVHFDKKTMLKNLSGETQALHELLELVLSSFPEKIKQLKQALYGNNATELKAILHSLRGSAQNMHFPLLATKAAQLEQNFTQLSTEQAQKLYQEIESEWQQLKQIILREMA
jgi:signal transduction histidine kinase/DNA-binding response OmpR family regulator